MVTLGTYHRKDGEEIVLTNTYYGLSTDDKPIENEKNGSIYLELDTGKAFFYDLEGNQWIETAGGGGGGSEETMFIITKDGNEGSLDKTWNEIKAAYDAGKMCVVQLDYDAGGGSEEHWQEVVTYIRGGGGTNYVIMSVYSDQLGIVSGCGYEAATADGTLYQMGGD